MATGIGGEIVWWCPTLDDAGEDSATLNDLSGNGYNGTLTNVDAATAWVDDNSYGGTRGIEYTGTDDHVTSSNISLSFPLTVTCWMRRTGTIANAIVAAVVKNSTNWMWFGIGSDATGAQARVYKRPAVSPIVMESIAAFDDAWQFFAVVLEDTTDYLAYLHSQEILDSSGTATTYFSTPIHFRMGNRDTGNNTESQQMVWDDARLFNRILTPTEIASLATRRAYQPSASNVIVVED